MDLQTALAHVRELGYLIAWSSAEDTWYVAHSLDGAALDDGAAKDDPGVPIPEDVAIELLYSGLLEDIGSEGSWPRGRDAWVSGWYQIRDVELERIVAEAVARKNAAVPDSAEYRMAIRQLKGLRYSREGAGGMIEQMDPDGWGESCSPP